MSNDSPKKAIQTLQENSSNFFNTFYAKHKEQMNCKEGCDHCCHVELSLFPSEAQIILDWAQNLSSEDKKELLNLLKSSHHSLEKIKPICTFLFNKKCAIYPVRPIICRTQGLLLQYKTQEKNNQINLVIDGCLLNFKEKDLVPNRAECLDLDRLNALQSIAENSFQKEMQINKNSSPRKKDERIAMRDIKKNIISLLEIV